ncbi:MAG: branched-chain amino acid ABC transporter permease, partial [Rhodospirillales bacterium]
MNATVKTDPTAELRNRHRWRPVEALPWLTAFAAFALLPDYAALGTQIIIMIIFALSMDLILGYAGVVSLGHAAYFGAGAYATGMLSALLGWNEPLTGLLVGGLAGGALGLLSGLVLLRYHGLTLLMLTLAFAILLQEAANTAAPITGGFDGLQGISIDPIFGLFENDLWGHHYYWYSLSILFLVFLVARRIVHSPFGRSLVGVRENVRRMNAI